MKKIPKSLFTTLVLASGILLVSQCTSKKNEAPVASEKIADMSVETPVEHGRYLVTIGGCNDCHSPKVFDAHGNPMPDTTRLLSGHPHENVVPAYDASMIAPGRFALLTQDLTAAIGPWGTTYSANLTPDTATGLGAWTEEIFIKALRTGKHMGIETGRPIMPPMPWPEFAQMKDDDIKAIFAYLKSLKPVNNKVPDYTPPTAATVKN